MKAMVLRRPGLLSENPEPLELAELPVPESWPGEVLVRVTTCGVCHTELDEIEGRTAPPNLPVVPGHQAVGRVEALGKGVVAFSPGERVGVGWIHSSCRKCEHCLEGKENLCAEFKATGRDVNGGYAEFIVVPADSAYPIPAEFGDAEAAPLLCAGAIGYRSLRLTGIADGQRLGLFGFGASAHIVLQLTQYLLPRTTVFVFARSEVERRFGRELGAVWAGDFCERPAERLHAAIDTTPVWKPVLSALENLAPGGRLVVNAIRKEEADRDVFLGLDYPKHLWLEKEIKSVANVTRRDIREFLPLAAKAGIRPGVTEYRLEDANLALQDLRQRGGGGAKVLRVRQD